MQRVAYETAEASLEALLYALGTKWAAKMGRNAISRERFDGRMREAMALQVEGRRDGSFR